MCHALLGTVAAIVNRRIGVITLCSLHAAGETVTKQVYNLICNLSSARKETNKQLK